MIRSFLPYLLEVSACLVSFYFFYLLFLRRKTFFRLNRAFLLCACVMSFIIPELSVNIDEPAGSTADVVDSAFSSLRLLPGEQPMDAYYSDYHPVFEWTYLVGALFVLCRSVFFLARMRAIVAGATIELYGNYRAIRGAFPRPFVFFNLLFLPEGDINPIILEHEKTHVRQHHWVDLAVLEILSIVLWFNPFVVFVGRALKEQHEFLADASVVRSGVAVVDYYQCLLAELHSLVSFKFIHNFSYHAIKNRVNMLTREKNKNYTVALYFVFVPIAAALIMGFGNRHPQVISTHFMRHGADTLSFVSPVATEGVTSVAPFGLRENPFTKKMQNHTGMDFSAPTGQPVMSVADGIVIDAFSGMERGNFVVIRHDDTYSTTYSHLQRFDVSKGDRVIQGQRIGTVGSTGLSTGPHLHFEVHVKGDPVDPEPFLR